MTARIAALLLAIVFVTGCVRPPTPRDVGARYPDATAPIDDASGTIDVVLNSPTGALSITVNDQIVVKREYSARARITAVPAGPASVHVAMGGSCEQSQSFDREVEVLPGGIVTIALPGGEQGTACAIAAGAGYIGLNILALSLAILLVL